MSGGTGDSGGGGNGGTGGNTGNNPMIISDSYLKPNAAVLQNNILQGSLDVLNTYPRIESEGFRNTSAQLSNMSQRTQERFVVQDAMKIIQNAQESGRITEAEARELAARYGISL